MKERLDYIDGIKGIACFMVVAAHFFATFGYVFWGLDILDSKLDLIFSGPWAVRFFFMMSAFLVSNSLFKNMSVNKIKITIVKRYLRLALPLIPICFCIWCLQKLDLFANDTVAVILKNDEIATYFSQPLGFIQIFTAAIYKIIFLSDITFNSNFWMIQPLFFGNIIAIILCLLTYDRKYVKFIFVFCIILSAVMNDNYLPFIVGTAISYYYSNQKQEENSQKASIKSKIIWSVVFFAGLIIGEFKGYLLVFFESLNIEKITELQFLLNSNFYNTISISFIFVAILRITYMKKILSWKIFTGMGIISYYVFLLHWPIVCTFSTKMFLLLNDNFGVATAARITFAATLVVVVLVSMIFNQIVEKPCEKITKKIVNRL